MRVALQVGPLSVHPPHTTVLAISPLLACSRTRSYWQSGGDVHKLVEATRKLVEGTRGGLGKSHDGWSKNKATSA